MLGALIGAGTSLLGGLFQKKAQDKEAQRQREFAQNGIQWKVEDAKKAGIAPLAALGASTHSYAAQPVGDYGVGAAGQDISRAIQQSQPARGRADAYTVTAQQLELEHGALRNDLLRSQIAKLNQPGTGPGITVDSDGSLIPGQPNSGIPGIQVQPSKTVVTTANVPHNQAGAVPDMHFTQTPGGGYYPIPSSAVKQQIEDMLIPETMWSLRNNVLPTFSKSYQQGHHPGLQKVLPLAWDEEYYFHPIDGYKKRKIQIGTKRHRNHYPRGRP